MYNYRYLTEWPLMATMATNLNMTCTSLWTLTWQKVFHFCESKTKTKKRTKHNVSLPKIMKINKREVFFSPILQNWIWIFNLIERKVRFHCFGQIFENDHFGLPTPTRALAWVVVYARGADRIEQNLKDRRRARVINLHNL